MAAGVVCHVGGLRGVHLARVFVRVLRLLDLLLLQLLPGRRMRGHLKIFLQLLLVVGVRLQREKLALLLDLMQVLRLLRFQQLLLNHGLVGLHFIVLVAAGGWWTLLSRARKGVGRLFHLYLFLRDHALNEIILLLNVDLLRILGCLSLGVAPFQLLLRVGRVRLSGGGGLI